jgi:hypothetical protein
MADLDSDAFEVRRRAAQELEKLGDLAEPALRAALKDKPAAGARRQIEELLEALSNWPTERLRIARAVTAVEQMGTPAARLLLEDLTRGAPQALLTREARAAVDRLAKRPPRPSH